jgi:competence ComEA-like helix-hairpin-helix protein
MGRPMKDDTSIPENLSADEQPPAENDRSSYAPSPSPIHDIRRYRPGIALLAAVILFASVASCLVRWADSRFSADASVSRVICRTPGGALEILPRTTTVGAALEQWGEKKAGIGNKTLKRRIPDGSRITVAETRDGRRVVIDEMPAAERYALGLDFDINNAAAPDIALITGIGEASAARIVAWRKRHGDFMSKADLYAVPGLGADRARTIARYVSFGPDIRENPEPTQPAEKEESPRPSEKLAKDDPPIDINNAAATDLMRIPGVGEVTAGRIVETREKSGPFKTAADLEKVNGIGKRKAERIGEYVRF